MEEGRNSYKIVVGKHERKRPLGRTRHRLEINIRMDLSEIRWEVVDWIHPAHDGDMWWALVTTVMNLRVS
jgi:hypothetical protein